VFGAGRAGVFLEFLRQAKYLKYHCLACLALAAPLFSCQARCATLSLDFVPFMEYIIVMKRIKEFNDEFNKHFNDEVFMPMIKFATTLIFITVIVDFGSQLIEAIDILTL